MNDSLQVVCFSGGKDSTALVLRMAELGERFVQLFNVTGDELPNLITHIAKVVALTKSPLHCTNPGFSLQEKIRDYKSLPNQNMRWCTRQLKIEPTKAWLIDKPNAVLCVGLRADEADRGAATLYGESVTYRCPFQEWGWKLADVTAYLQAKGISVPERTDCALCYDQRISEWYRLWKNYPDRYAAGEALEELTGHTFRSVTLDTWPASLREMRLEFERGRLPRDVISMPLFGDDYTVKDRNRCRVCSF